MFIELLRKTKSFKQLHVALEENSNISILFCRDLEHESRYVWQDYGDCLPDQHTTTTTKPTPPTYPTTEAPTPPINQTTEEPTEHTESTTEAPTTYPTRTSPRTTAPTTHPTTPTVTPTTIDPDDNFVCPHGGNDLFPRPGHCNQFYLCKDGYPAKMYIFVSSRHPPDFIGFIF